ncbi:MAG: 5-oxoprolinase subunit PxpB [Bacteroidetes bacterium]|nr:5-oxoprolinase subunit PxpB [Bacteroidota bacterium]MBS1932290.1 5-oxoprolinase subunit PxpB [Bacteroidota bacterium]
MFPQKSYSIFSLGDAAITIDFGNIINEKINDYVLDLFHAFQQRPFSGMVDLIPAYSSLSIYYDPVKLRKSISHSETAFEYIKKEVVKFIEKFSWEKPLPAKVMKIPVCYDEYYATDLSRIAEIKNLEKQEIVHLHYGQTYRVYMIGFLPGFPYLGTLDEKIAMPRKPEPQMVKAGSVAIAGRQTGIYPLESPGGWHIIGKTPLKIFDANRESPSLLSAGDVVEFYPIDKNEFLNLSL